MTPAARKARCQLFTSDVKVRLEIGKQDVFYCPDLLVSCDPDDRATYYRERPSLIVEVLSESTERLDRRDKMLAYQTIKSLQEYVLVAQDVRRVEVYRRTDDGAPSIHTEGPVRVGKPRHRSDRGGDLRGSLARAAFHLRARR